jgi:hypothetical protein
MPNYRTTVLRRAGAALVLLALLGTRGPGGQAPPPSKGVELMNQGRFEEALPILDEEVKADPGSFRIGKARANCLVHLGRWREALEAASGLVQKFPEEPEAAILKGDCLFLTFRPALAIEAYTPVLADPRWGPSALGKAAVAALALNDPRQALALIQSGRRQGIPVTGAILQAEFRAEDDPSRKLAVLRELVAREAGNESYRDEVALYEALASKEAPANAPPAQYPGETAVREIYREPSLRVTLGEKREAWLALDTGSERALLNDDLARKLKLPELSSAAYRGWGYQGARDTRVVLLDRLQVAGRVLTGLPVLVNKRDAEFWTKKAGYIGLGPFLGDAVLYDRRKGVFALWPPGTPHAQLLGEGGHTLPVLWYRGLPLIPVSLQGGEPHPFLLDTGAPYTLLDRERSARLGIKVKSGKYRNVHGLGLSGAFSASVVEGIVVDVGSRSFVRPLALVTEIPQEFPVPLYGILGRDLLNEFKIVFDAPAGTVSLKSY